MYRNAINRKTTDLQTLKQRAFAQRRKPMLETLESRRLLSAGDLDTTFSGDGKQTTDLGASEQANKVLVQSDGKVLVVGAANGDARIVRYNTNGTLDTTFDGDGSTRLSWSGTETFTDAALLPDGRIVVGGNHSGGWWLARYKADGTLDVNTGFGGSDGIYNGSSQGGSGSITELELQGSTIITADAAGNVRRHSGSTGALDTSFGSGGTVNIAAATPVNRFDLRELIVQPDGKLLVAGSSDGFAHAPQTHMAVARLNANGSVDTGFASGGVYRRSFDSVSSIATAMSLQSGGKIVVLSQDGGADSNMHRLNPNGTDDTTFAVDLDAGSGNIVNPSVNSSPPGNLDVAIDSAQRIIVSGTALNYANNSDDFFVARYSPNGVLESGFGDGGSTLTNFGSSDATTGTLDQATAGVAIAPSGAIVVAGYSSPGQLSVARLQGGDSTTPPADNIYKDSSGVVHGVGTSGNDTIAVTSPGDGITVTVNGVSESFTGVTGIRLDGLAGNDQLRDDRGTFGVPITLVGGDGNDTFHTFIAETTILGGAGDDAVDLSFAAVGVPELFDGGTGRDSIALHLQNDIDLNDHPGVEDASAEDGNLIGNALDNRLSLSEGGNLTGNGGNDTLSIGSFGGTLDGGAGNDVLSVSDANDGHSSPTTLIGGAGNDSITGSLNDDSITGGDGNDTIRGGTAGFAGGNDSINAGIGDDWIYVRDPDHDDSPDTVDGGAGFDRAERDPTDTVTNVEAYLNEAASGPVYLQNGTLYVDGTAGNDNIRVYRSQISDEEDKYVITINGVSHDYDNKTNPPPTNGVVVRSFAGDDHVDAWFSGRVEAGDGNDTIYHHAEYTPTPPTVIGGNGNDRLIYDSNPPIETLGQFDGGAGRDTFEIRYIAPDLDLRLYPTVEDATIAYGKLTGNGLNNYLKVTQSGSIYGGDGNDTLEAGSDAVDSMAGENGNDLLIGYNVARDPASTWSMTLNGGAGNDTLQSGLWSELLIGGDGFDELTYAGRTAAVTVTLGSGANDGQAGEADNASADIERVRGGSGSDSITGSNSNNELFGNGGNDTLLGLGGADAIFAGVGNDRVYGGAGNDYIEGNTGNDTLYGDAGLDQLLGHEGDDYFWLREGEKDTADGGVGYHDRAQIDGIDSTTGMEAFIP